MEKSQRPMSLYGRYLRSKLELFDAGLGRTGLDNRYFCTPKGTRIIGWEGVDGIHYCFVKKFGDMVFSVTPSALPGEYVHPIARNFEDFLRLIISCGGTSAMEQAHGWNREQWEHFLQENEPSLEDQEILCKLTEKFSL